MLFPSDLKQEQMGNLYGSVLLNNHEFLFLSSTRTVDFRKVFPQYFKSMKKKKNTHDCFVINLEKGINKYFEDC